MSRDLTMRALRLREQAPGPLSKAVRTGLELPSGWTACPSLGVELEQLRVIPIKVLCLLRPAGPQCAVQPQWPRSAPVTPGAPGPPL